MSKPIAIVGGQDSLRQLVVLQEEKLRQQEVLPLPPPENLLIGFSGVPWSWFCFEEWGHAFDNESVPVRNVAQRLCLLFTKGQTIPAATQQESQLWAALMHYLTRYQQSHAIMIQWLWGANSAQLWNYARAQVFFCAQPVLEANGAEAQCILGQWMRRVMCHAISHLPVNLFQHDALARQFLMPALRVWAHEGVAQLQDNTLNAWVWRIMRDRIDSLIPETFLQDPMAPVILGAALPAYAAKAVIE